jgi:hypothetical protein
MTIASLVGFIVSAQFVTVYGVELPYYVVLVGASAIKLAGYEAQANTATDPEHDSELAGARNENEKLKPAMG